MHHLTPSHLHRATRTVTLPPSCTTLLLTLSYKHQMHSHLHPYPAHTNTHPAHIQHSHTCKHTCTHTHPHAHTTHMHTQHTCTHTHTHNTNTHNTQLEARTTNLRRIISSVSWKRLAHLFCGHLGSRLEQSPRKVGGTVVRSVAAECENLTHHCISLIPRPPRPAFVACSTKSREKTWTDLSRACRC